MGKARVAVIRTAPEVILRDIDQVCHLAGLREALEPGAPTVLKDQIAWRYPFPGANTTPWQLEGAVKTLKSAGFGRLSLVRHRSGGARKARGGDPNHYASVCEKHNIPILYTFEPSDMRWIEYRPRARLHVLKSVFDRGIHLPDHLIGKNLVHLPTLKCDAYTTTSGAMQNAFGALLNRRRHYARSWIHRTLVDLLAIEKEICCGLFVLMDGTTAGNGGGPGTMLPVKKDVMLASADPVAIDAVAAKLMGFDPMRIEYIRLAHDDGLGVGDPRQIELVGADIAREGWGFSLGSNAASMVGHALWQGRLRHLGKLVFKTRLVNMFALGSDAYHNLYRWRRKDRMVFEEWTRRTPWGQLFEAYALDQSDRIVGGSIAPTAAY